MTTVHSAARHIWPWVAQIGQGRGGFYSYDGLENLFGCDIHSADRIHPEWQSPEVGSAVKLAPELALVVALVEPGIDLVLRGGVPIGAGSPPFDFSWAFALIPDSNPDRSVTRLVVRERYRYTRPWASVIVRPASVISALMSRRMLRGIKDRAQMTERRQSVLR